LALGPRADGEVGCGLHRLAGAHHGAEQAVLPLLALAPPGLSIVEEVVERAPEGGAVDPQAVEGAGLDQALEDLAVDAALVDLGRHVGEALEAAGLAAGGEHPFDRPFPHPLDGAEPEADL